MSSKKTLFERLDIKKIFSATCIIWIIIIGYDFLNTTSRKEDSYIVCEIVQQDTEGYTQVKLPDDEIIWIAIGDEVVSENGDYVVLRIVRYFNAINQLIGQHIMDTTIYNK